MELTLSALSELDTHISPTAAMKGEFIAEERLYAMTGFAFQSDSFVAVRDLKFLNTSCRHCELNGEITMG